MHELGLATAVLDSAIEVGLQNNATKIKVINVNVGEKAAVIPEAFKAAFDALKELEEYSLCKHAKIVCSETPDSAVYIENIEIETNE